MSQKQWFSDACPGAGWGSPVNSAQLESDWQGGSWRAGLQGLGSLGWEGSVESRRDLGWSAWAGKQTWGGKEVGSGIWGGRVGGWVRPGNLNGRGRVGGR